MEEQLLQALGKISGIGGISVGVFLLLFREVIRKNIFPTLSDVHAYRLIRQFMYLTFAIAISGIVAWTYVSAAPAAGQNEKTSQGADADSSAGGAEKPSGPAANIAGTWKASVKYSWGDSHAELFEFEVNGRELAGSASYVTGKRGILNGKIDGNQINFETTSYSEVGQQRYQEKHRHRGAVAGDAIEFVLDTDSGYDSTPPLKFTAHRDATK
ncbi:MAG: hypothetical protein EXQ48_08985 [Acidobacteria bacterium]|nr:hypothetical protein [Acidobacteriota bacterium]